MKIEIAGAGAGKTTTIAKHIVKLRKTIEENKKIFCLAFTNNAVKCISNKLQEYYGTIPNNIIISTIHSFLYQEIIRPYYYLLYDKQYHHISICNLPDNVVYKSKAIKKLEENNIIHQTVIPERAKWIVVGKSNDKKDKKIKREIIKNILKTYCGAICIDESQDIEDNISMIIETLNFLGIPLLLMGDPKQDLRGNNSFKVLTERYYKNVDNINICHRCPQSHLILSNSIVIESEKQYSEKACGNLLMCFESDKKINDLLFEKSYDLVYISQRHGIYETHGEKKEMLTEKVFDAIFLIMKQMYSSSEELDIAKHSYSLACRLLSEFESTGDKKRAMSNIIKFELSKNDYASIISLLPDKKDEKRDKKIIVNSIDSIKGQEANKCLFILTTDLAYYLFGTKFDDTKYKHRLYVALTRSLYELTVYVPVDVEEKFSKSFIENFFLEYNFTKEV